MSDGVARLEIIITPAPRMRQWGVQRSVQWGAWNSIVRRVPLGARVLAREPFALVGLFALIGLSFCFRLGAVVVSDMDEGTYLYAGKLVSQGALPYRDFLLAHPPLIALLMGGWVRLFGAGVMPARLAYLAVILTSTVPLYLVTRALAGSRLAGLLGVSVYMAGMLLLANMGRTIRLEPLMNAFLIAGFACYVLRPDSLRLRALLGALFAAAVLVKLVAIIPAGLLLAADLLWLRPNRRLARSWLATAGGGALILVPAAALLLSQPAFVDSVLRAQLSRPGLPLHTRLYFVEQASLRYPVIPIALVAATWLVGRARDARLRAVSLVAVCSTLTLLIAFRTFFGYYLVQVLPWVAIVFATFAAAALSRLPERWSAWRRPLLIAGILTFGSGLPLAYSEVYYRTAHDHVSSPARIVSLLREGNGYVYSMYPSFALWSGRELFPSYYVVDSLVPRITGRMVDADFVRTFAGSQALVLWTDELQPYPLARAYVNSHFSVLYEDANYVLWAR